MKKFKTIVSMLAIAAMLTLLPGSNMLTASAEGDTYAVKYVDGKWCYQKGSSYDDSILPHREVYYLLTEDLKEGDAVVVYNDKSDAPLLDLGSVRIGNLTIPQNNAFTMVSAGSYDLCYVLGGSTCSITGPVQNAYVYDYPSPARCSFNSNVSNLEVLANTSDGLSLNLGCGGTVRHLYAHTEGKTYYDLSGFSANTLSIENGVLKDPWRFSTTPSADDLAMQEKLEAANQGQSQDQAQATPPAQTPAPQNPANSDDLYDDVPKTGDSVPYLHVYLWLFGTAALCFLGSRIFKKISASAK